MFASKAFIFLALVGIATAIDCISEYGQRCKPKNEMNPHFAPKYTTGDPCFLENNVRQCYVTNTTNMKHECTCYAECGCINAPVVPSCDNSAVPKNPDCSGDKKTFCVPNMGEIINGVAIKNTMCEYCGVDLVACNKVCSRLVTEAEKKEIVDKHNELRRKVAKGLETQGVDGPQPKAADMYELEWDDSIAATAQRWVDQCQSGHDRVRKVPGLSVGQNAASGSSLIGAINAWYNEVKKFSTSNVDSMVWGKGETGHYTQVVWGSTKKVGCGFIRYRPETGSVQKHVICNYGPAGNMPGGKVYTRGETASLCPKGSNDGLCKQ